MEEIVKQFDRPRESRAISKDRRQWIEGYVYKHESPLQCIGPRDKDDTAKYFILKTGFADWNMTRPVDMTEVLPETVGEFTGEYDRKKTKIYEGDIVECPTRYGTGKAVIVYHNGGFKARFDSRFQFKKCGKIVVYYEINSKFLVIGNMTETPNMLMEE